MQEMVIYGVSFDMVGKQQIVLLKTADGNKFLPIWIGHPEAAAILMKLQGASTPRPMTHDLLSEMLSKLDAHVVKIAVTELRENTFYALITVAVNGSEIEIDSHGRTSVPGVFAAGDATTTPYKQIVIAMGEGSKAALSAFDHLIRTSAPAQATTAAAA